MNGDMVGWCCTLVTGTGRLNVKKINHGLSATWKWPSTKKRKRGSGGGRKLLKTGQCRALLGMLISTGPLLNCNYWWSAWILRPLKSALASPELEGPTFLNSARKKGWKNLSMTFAKIKDSCNFFIVDKVEIFVDNQLSRLSITVSTSVNQNPSPQTTDVKT